MSNAESAPNDQPSPMSTNEFQAGVVNVLAEWDDLIRRQTELLETVKGRETILGDMTVDELATNAESREWALEWARQFAANTVESFEERLISYHNQRQQLAALIERN